MRLSATLALPLLLSLAAFAQSRPPQETGTVSGHILCSDTQRPARLAEVRLVPTSITAAAKPNFFEDLAALGNQLSPVQTDMSGSFTLRNVKTGSYYLRVDYPGYVTPLLTFSRDQLAHPSLDTQQLVANELQLVSVAAHAATRADATLQRASAIFGTVAYDDGSPAVGISIDLYQRDPKGEFKEEVAQAGFGTTTDALGHFRIDSLSAGSYVLAARFSISETSISTMPVPGGGTGTMQMNIQKVLFSLPLYSGNALRRKDAVPINLDSGQDAPAVSLALPLSKLHSVSGLVTAKDGHAISGGEVALLYADGREELSTVPIGRDDGRFNFLYVPEDSYVVEVKQAKDVTQIEAANAAGTNPKFHTEDKTLRSYGTTEQPLTVEGEHSSLLLVVPEKDAATIP